MRKGIKYKNETIVKQLKTMNWEWCVYHTRVKSVGTVNDKNCHPFKAGNIILAMNGTESGYAGLANALDITDTQAVLLSVKKFNLDLFDALKPLSSNFIGFVDGIPYATSPNNYKSYDIAKEDNAVVIASSLPYEFKEVYRPVGKPFVWKSTEALNIEKKPVYTPSVTHRSWIVEDVSTESSYLDSWRKKVTIQNEIYEDEVLYQCSGCTEEVYDSETDEWNGMRWCPYCGEILRKSDIICTLD
jgi:DNA-directed RNA polymerase subunit RPC12/RpoP